MAEIKRVGSPLSRFKRFSYKKVEYDEDGWANALFYLPCEYDLVFLKVNGSTKIKHGWRTECGWDGLHIERYDEILAWKKDEEYNYF